ncbi:hypothetical protein J4G63_01690 [Aeromonas sobria]|uniref:hypothetical protein n=1 Tax=Aeromonas sobria TaxID=646 RepID=UPI00158754A5|nr:hypothetical protein [Aeromonas sobria]MBS4685971.1 hypothetical protein [Aeromonas sobria]
MSGIICIHLWFSTTKAHKQGLASTKSNSIAQTSTKNYQQVSSDHEKAAIGTKYGHPAWKTGAFMADYHYSASVASQR